MLLNILWNTVYGGVVNKVMRMHKGCVGLRESRFKMQFAIHATTEHIKSKHDNYYTRMLFIIISHLRMG